MHSPLPSPSARRLLASKHALYYYGCFTIDEDDENRECGIRQTQRLSFDQVPTFDAEVIDRTPKHRVGVVVYDKDTVRIAFVVLSNTHDWGMDEDVLLLAIDRK